MEVANDLRNTHPVAERRYDDLGAGPDLWDGVLSAFMGKDLHNCVVVDVANRHPFEIRIVNLASYSSGELRPSRGRLQRPRNPMPCALAARLLHGRNDWGKEQLRLRFE